MKIVTFNLRYIWKSEVDGINSFVHRAGLIYEKINQEKPDVIAFQEVVSETQLPVLKKLLPEYSFLGHGRSERYDGEGLFTAIRNDSCEVDKFETFWISPTPYVPGSRFDEQSVCPRTCVMTLVRNKLDNSLIRVFNIHLDNESEEARGKGIDCVLGFIKVENKRMPLDTVVLGDFNTERHSYIHELMRKNGFCDITQNITTTFHKYGKSESKIDYIYVSESLTKKIITTETWTDSHMGIYLSDHYPVCAIIYV